MLYKEILIYRKAKVLFGINLCCGRLLHCIESGSLWYIDRNRLVS